MRLPAHVDHLIVGAGFAGLCAAIKLAEDGETDYVVIERGDDVGGTWRDNTYPGACCDVPSQLYSYSFARNPEWSSSYSPQPEIQDYLRRVARELRRPRPHALRNRARARGLGRRGPGLAMSYDVRRGGRDDARHRHGQPVGAAAAADRGSRHVRGPDLPLGALGPLRRPGRQAGGGHRDRGVVDPDRARAAEDAWPTSTSTSARLPG